LDNLIAEIDKVFIFMAAKVAGTSMKTFTGSCVGSDHPDNFVNVPRNLQPFLLKNLHPPKIITSHIYSDAPLIHAIQNAPRKSLLIYLYRDETERLISSIQDVVKAKVCTSPPSPWVNTTRVIVDRTDDECKVSEEYFVKNILAKQQQEIGISIPATLTCPVWKEIDENGPTMLFIDSTQATPLQEVLSKRFCPHVPPIAVNVGNKKSTGVNYTVVRQQDQEEVPIKTWLDAKRSTLEFALGLSAGSCKHRTRTMEDILLSCPNDKMVRVFPRE